LRKRLVWCAGSAAAAVVAWLVPAVPAWAAGGLTGFALGVLLWFGLLGADNRIEGGLIAVTFAVLGALLADAGARVAERARQLRTDATPAKAGTPPRMSRRAARGRP
jgi:hypothetical protein